MDLPRPAGVGLVEPRAAPARTRPGASGALLAFGVVLAASAVYAGWGRDFASFYWSAAALAAGGNPYEAVADGAAINLNPPHATLLLVPLTLLPLGAAFAVWQAVQLWAWGGVLRSISQESEQPELEFIAAAALFPGTLAQLAQGQWGFLLAWMVGAAWIAQRRGRALECGAWIGAATAIKPFVGLLALILAWRGQVRAGAAALGIAACAWGAGLLWMGLDVYGAWRDAAAAISWAAYPSNASLLGMAERALSLNHARASWAAGAAIVAVTTLLLCRRTLEDAVSWTMGLTAALLVSPVGWLYYGWIVAPPLLTLRRWPPVLKTGLVLLWIPPGFLSELSTATIGLLLVWSALAIETVRASRASVRQVGWS